MPRQAKGGPKLKDETRAYTVTEADLSEWLTGGTLFYIKKIEVLSGGDIEFTVTTAKQAERTVIDRPYKTVNDQRREHGLPPLPETDVTGPEPDPEDEHGREAAAGRGPAIIEEGGGPVGTADPVPMIASSGEVAKKKQIKSMRQMQLEARAAGVPEPKSNITHRSEGEDDPVPSAIPR